MSLVSPRGGDTCFHYMEAFIHWSYKGTNGPPGNHLNVEPPPPPPQLWAASHGTWSQLDDGQEEGKGLPNNSVSHKILQGGMKPWV